MQSFIDNSGRRWLLEITVSAVKRVRALCDGLDILNVISFDDKGNPETTVLEKIANDPVLLVDVLYAVCKPEADAQGVSDEDFGKAMVGDIIEDATNKLLDAIVDFFPEAKRKLCQKALGAARRFAAQNTKTLINLLDDPELDAKLYSQVEMSKNTSTIVPELPE